MYYNPKDIGRGLNLPSCSLVPRAWGAEKTVRYNRLFSHGSSTSPDNTVNSSTVLAFGDMQMLSEYSSRVIQKETRTQCIPVSSCIYAHAQTVFRPRSALFILGS